MQELQALTRLTTILHWLVIIFVFLAGALQVSKLLLDKKIEVIREELTSTKIAEYEKAIEKLQGKSKEHEKVEMVIEQAPDRKIPEHLIPQVKAELSEYEGSTVRLACDKQDKEALAFAEQLKRVFQESGWTVKGVNQATFSKPVKDIVIVLNHEEQKPKANYLFSLLMALNLKSTARMNKNQVEDLGIVVGKKD